MGGFFNAIPESGIRFRQGFEKLSQFRSSVVQRFYWRDCADRLATPFNDELLASVTDAIKQVRECSGSLSR